MPLLHRLTLAFLLVFATGIPGIQGIPGLVSFTNEANAANNTAQPIAIEADRMQYDNRRQTNVFIGNVVLSQGGFEIRADRIYMRQNKDGAQFATATGSPARFRHVQPGSAGTVEGSGKELRYNNQSRELEILNDATLRRVQKGANSDEVRGAKIVYRADRDSFVVEGGKGGGRVKVIIQPKSSQTSGKAADLKSSPTLSQ